MGTEIHAVFEEWQPDDDHAKEASRLGLAISEALFNEVCDAHRLPAGRFYVEESDETMYPPDVYPVVYVDAEDRRYSVEVDVTVTALPSVEVEKKRGEELEKKLAGMVPLPLGSGDGT